MAILIKEICIFKEILIKIPMAFFHENGQGDPKIHVKLKEILDSKNNLEKEELAWKIHIFQC